MSNMNEGAKTDKRLTLSEREHSPCTKRKQRDPLPKSRFWEGMNDRDETDECSRLPVGRCLSNGFLMMNPDYDGEEL